MLDEELGSRGMHLIPQVADPIRLRRPSAGAALAAANHPVKLVEPRGKVDRFEQRFDRQEAERGRDPRKMRDAAPRFEVVLYRRTEPDVRPTVAPIGRKHRRRVLRPFAQKHPDKRWRRADQIPQIHAPGRRRVIVEDIRHACTKDAAALAGGQCVAVPAKRPTPVRFARALAFSAHVPEITPFIVAPAEPFGDRRGVTSIAGRTHPHASYPWIERRVGPSDLRNGSH